MPAEVLPLPEVLVLESGRSFASIVSADPWRERFRLTIAQTKIDLLVALRERRFALLLLDLPDDDLGDFLHRAQLLAPQAQVFLIGQSDRTADRFAGPMVEVLRQPVDPKWLFLKAQSTTSGQDGTALQPIQAPQHGLIGQSAAISRVHQLIDSVALSTATVFLTGESGTGKDLTARAIHAASARAKGPFIEVNCAALTAETGDSDLFGHLKGAFPGALSERPGALQSADGGTVFLDEVCELSLTLQARLLRSLENAVVTPLGASKARKVNLRVICSSRQDPLDAVKDGRLREDLYYRLYVVPIHLPALRDRGGDVIELAQAALQEFGIQEGHYFTGLDGEVMDLLVAHDWPGNVRQLFNTMRTLAVLHRGGAVTRHMLPAFLQGAAKVAAPIVPIQRLYDLSDRPLAEVERLVIEAALERNGGSVQKAARVLDVSPSTLYRKIEGWKARE